MSHNHLILKWSTQNHVKNLKGGRTHSWLGLSLLPPNTWGMIGSGVLFDEDLLLINIDTGEPPLQHSCILLDRNDPFSARMNLQGRSVSLCLWKKNT